MEISQLSERFVLVSRQNEPDSKLVLLQLRDWPGMPTDLRHSVRETCGYKTISRAMFQMPE